MKRFLSLLVMAALLLMLPAACAECHTAKRTKLYGGPGTEYLVLETLASRAGVTPLETENGYALVEFTRNKKTVRGYVDKADLSGAGRLSAGTPYERDCTVNVKCNAYSAPSSAAGRRSALKSGQSALYLDSENGYAYIEFCDSRTQQMLRGYVDEDNITQNRRKREDKYADRSGKRPSGRSSGSSGKKYPSVSGVSATPAMKLAFRTGPNTKYSELYTLPRSTELRALEYESGNGVTWVLVEFTYDSQTVRAYTGLKRMTVNGTIEWADHSDREVRAGSRKTVYAAPSGQAAYRGKVDAGDYVTVLGYDGEYTFIEFNDGDSGQLMRGYLKEIL